MGIFDKIKNVADIENVNFCSFLSCISDVRFLLRYFFEISYDGTNYHGWQKQPNSNTIQETIENCLSTIAKQKIDIVLKLSVSLETIEKRISERQALEKRPDDNEEIAIKKINILLNYRFWRNWPGCG